MYKQRNEVERLFRLRRLKEFRRIFLGFIVFALIFDALR